MIRLLILIGVVFIFTTLITHHLVPFLINRVRDDIKSIKEKTKAKKKNGRTKK